MGKRIIVCLCGSTRFRQAYIDANRQETLAGKIVLSVGGFSHSGDTFTEEQKATLDQLHLDKIEMADEVLFLNCHAQKCPQCGTVWTSPGVTIQVCSCCTNLEQHPPKPYLGESSLRELAHARALGKTVRFLNKQEGLQS